MKYFFHSLLSLSVFLLAVAVLAADNVHNHDAEEPKIDLNNFKFIIGFSKRDDVPWAVVEEKIALNIYYWLGNWYNPKSLPSDNNNKEIFAIGIVTDTQKILSHEEVQKLGDRLGKIAFDRQISWLVVFDKDKQNANVYVYDIPDNLNLACKKMINDIVYIANKKIEELENANRNKYSQEKREIP